MNLLAVVTALLNYIDISGVTGPVTWEDLGDFCEGFLDGVEEVMEDDTDAQY